MPIGRTTQADIWPHRGAYHVLTYAEEGFSPLNIHAESAGISKEELVIFAEQVNRRFEAGSLFPCALVSAVPRRLIRDMSESNALRQHIGKFLRVNAETMRATKIVFDFRTPRVPGFVISAIELACDEATLARLEEVLILE